MPGGGRQDDQRGFIGVINGERIIGRFVHAQETLPLVALLAAQQIDDLGVHLFLGQRARSSVS
jgi:hypothetical protein